jgi:hypothetical protein
MVIQPKATKSKNIPIDTIAYQNNFQIQFFFFLKEDNLKFSNRYQYLHARFGETDLGDKFNGVFKPLFKV